MEKITGFGKKNSLTLPFFANNHFKNLRDESDEPIYTYNDELMRYFVGQIIKGGGCGSYNQSYISTISDQVFNNKSQELSVDGNVCKILDKYFEYTNKQRKKIEDEFDAKFDDYRDNDDEEKTEQINKELHKLSIHKYLQKLNLNDVKMDFDPTSLYPSAMWDENSVSPNRETGFVFKPDMYFCTRIQQSNF